MNIALHSPTCVDKYSLMLGTALQSVHFRELMLVGPCAALQMFATGVETLQVDMPAAQRPTAGDAASHAEGQQQQGQDPQGSAGLAASTLMQSSLAGSSVASSSRTGRNLHGPPLRQLQTQQWLMSKQQHQVFIDLSGGSMRCAAWRCMQWRQV